MGRKALEGQRNLPLAELDASLAERRGMIDAVLAQLKCSASFSIFIRWVFDVTDGGVKGELVRSYEQLRRTPRGMCCSMTTARETVAKARRLGLVTVVEHRRADGSQRGNGYSIDWRGVRRLLAPDDRADALPAKRTDTQMSDSDTHRCRIPTPTDVGIRHPQMSDSDIIEDNLLKIIKDPGPGPGAGPGPGVGIRPRCAEAPSEGQNDRSLPRMATAVGVQPCSRMNAVPGLQQTPRPRRDPASDKLRLDMLDTVSELVEARHRPVGPLPAEGLLHSVFKPIEERHLGDLVAMTRWFRRQLSAREPVALATEADLLLVLAAAVHARMLPERDLRKNRVAVFVAVVGRGRWYDAAPHVGEAHRRLEAILERFGRKAVLLGKESLYPKRKPKPEKE